MRKRLLVGSLTVAAVMSLAIGYLVSRDDADSEPTGEATNETVDPAIGEPALIPNDSVRGEPLPIVDVMTFANDSFSTEMLVGQPLVINLWFSTCVPCEKELPDFAATHLQYGDRVRFVGINPFPPSDTEEQFARERGVEYELLYDPNGEFGVAVGAVNYPITLFVDANGTITRQAGVLTADALAQIIETDLL